MFSSKHYHPFHILRPSPLPVLASMSAFQLTIGGVMYMHMFEWGGFVLSWGLLSLCLTLTLWWRDVVREGTYLGHHTPAVERGLRLGFILFIVSEVMFFFAFFWAYFHIALNPTWKIWCKWPPLGIEIFHPLGVPFLNTYILIMSGVTITLAHYYLKSENRVKTIEYFVYTTGLAFAFIALQFYEYINAPFSINDSAYGSLFFMLTGFHGFHVIIGTIFIVVCFVRYVLRHFTANNHFGFEAASWYWHFVDVVWIFLYFSIYVWPYMISNNEINAII